MPLVEVESTPIIVIDVFECAIVIVVVVVLFDAFSVI
jgi:hypothetical protein